jgi:hypothetical protein
MTIFALWRSIVPPHAAFVRPALVRWDPRASQRRKLRREEVLRAMSPVFAMSDEYAMYEEVGLNRAQGDADALGEPIDPTRSDNGIVIWSSEEVWGVEVARVVQFSIVQARRFREWAPQ